MLTFVTAFNGATVEQTAVKCSDLVCVNTIKEEALVSNTCTRIRIWAAENFAPLDGLRSFIWPPYLDWQKS